jgi:transcription elongation factor GreA
MKERVLLTIEGKQKLEDELTHLENVKKPELSERIQQASDEGDVSDNSEYEDLKEDFIVTEARIRELELTLERAEIIEPPTDGKIGLGSTVTIRAGDGEEETWRLVSPEEADSRSGTISTDSPVGSALVDRKVGDATKVKTPAGELVFTIVNVA